MWQATIANRFGSGIAKEVGNAHEENAMAATGKNLQTSFKSLSKADETVDLLNNVIGRQIGAAHPDADMQELSVLVLKEFHNNGLWLASEITNDKGEITGYSIYRSQLSDNMYTEALNVLTKLNKDGYTEKEQEVRDAFFKKLSEKTERQINAGTKF